MGCGLSKAHSNPEVLTSHGSARLTVHGRRLTVERHRAGWPQAHIAAAMGMSRKCVKTWIDRYATEYETGLATRSSRPHTMPTRTPDPDLGAENVGPVTVERPGGEDLLWM